MRTTKRFTPSVLRRFEKEGRGKGVFHDYVSWHRVSRSDPSSRGRSQIVFRKGFEHDQLSDLEHAIGCFAFLAHPDDLRTQFPLKLMASEHDLNEYPGIVVAGIYPGTLEIAQNLGIKSPSLREAGESKNWVSSTDLILTFLRPNSPPKLIAIAAKLSKDIHGTRVRELLRIERAYWHARNVEWLLITEKEFDRRVVSTLTRSLSWGLIHSVSNQQLEVATQIALSNLGNSYTHALRCIQMIVGNQLLAQQMFWQSTWHGSFRYDLRTGWRPHLPIWTVSEEEFLAFNPIISRRSAWTN